MSKDKIEVNMNVYDIPIVVEALEKAYKEIERLQKRIDKAIETIEDEGLVVAIKIINEKNDEILLSSKDLLIDILKGSDK